MMKNYKNCQSCGIPLKKDKYGGGTNKDGSRSGKYCSYCYTDGEFRQADWTASQMQEFVKGKMKEMGVPALLAGFFIRGIPKLERWENK